MAGLPGVIGGDLLRIVGGAAPVLGSILGSPLAGIAVSLIAHAFGVGSDDIASITSAVTGSPDATVKLRQIEADHAEALARIASTDYATEVDDRKNARQTAVLYKDFLRHMAYLVTVGFFAVLVMMFLPWEISAEGKNLLSMLVGMLASKWQTIIDFFFGSCHPHTKV